MIYPQTFEQKVGFDKVRALLLRNCMSDAGKALVDEISFLTDFTLVETALAQTQEMRTVCLMENSFPEGGYEDMLPFLKQLETIPTYYPDVQTLRKLQIQQETLRSLVRFFEKTKEGTYPRLKEICAPVILYPAISQRLDSLLDKFGQIRDNASAELAQIRSTKRQKEQAVSRKIQSILHSAQEQGLASEDATVSVRDGRMVIPVAAANKKKIPGLVYDESSSGRTSFIEPLEVMAINNQIRELDFAEQREIIRILIAFADFLRPYIPDLTAQAYFMAHVDFLHAKARMAIQMEAEMPVLSQDGGLFLQRARHPILEDTLKKEGKTIVPLTMRLDTNKRILLISGPNAGGKSVCLKTVGLLQYMLQCGLLVSTSPTSEFCLFDSLFIDIGDEQSIENDLSTYSSHLLNMRHIMENATERSLLLIDEFGSGTEPAAGGAIAEALLEQWELRGCYGVITTHYTNLKLYATASSGVLNGAMQFDVQQIQPLFKLETGVPGNSFAFELARKTGLSQDLIARAQEKAGTGFVEMERQIKSIARNRRRWEEKVAKIRQTDKTLETITDKYQSELAEIQDMRKKMLAQAKAQALQIVDEANKRVENVIKEIRESQAEKEKTRLARESIKEFKETLQEEHSKEEDIKIERKMEQLRRRKEKNEERKQQRAARQGVAAPVKNTQVEEERPLEVGDKVRTKDGGIVGEILRLGGKKHSVGFGQIITQITPDNLERISANEYRSITRSTPRAASAADKFELSERKLNFRPVLDVRGQRLDEALDTVSHFIDDALMVGVNEVRILHGTGTGVLRTEIRKFLRTVGGISSFEDEHVERGGAGITVIYFD